MPEVAEPVLLESGHGPAIESGVVHLVELVQRYLDGAGLIEQLEYQIRLGLR